ncbi:hypothetical protein HYV71_00715 [Candidatus Uhrbacteria bacterium]|nr:hypothetical protein [Candidatus Uhrbacteria bacterium]
MTKEEYLERGGELFLTRLVHALMKFLQFRPDTFDLKYRNGVLTIEAQEIKYSAAAIVRFETALSAEIRCDLFADQRLLEFANAKIYITFNGGKMLRVFSARDTLYRGIVLSEVQLRHGGRK